EGIAVCDGGVALSLYGCGAMADILRYESASAVRALSDRGGVVGIYFMPFLREEGQPMAADVIAHIEHAWNVCGEDHVGIGTDGGIPAIEFDEEYRRRHREDVRQRRARGISAPGETEDVYTFIPDLNDARRLDLLADALSARGHSDDRIEKLLGANFERLFGEVWGG
ncbi:MAG: membrane dipeptidase, partial [Longimicrobiales bacterium]